MGNKMEVSMRLYGGEVDYRIEKAKREAIEMVFERIDKKYGVTFLDLREEILNKVGGK